MSDKQTMVLIVECCAVDAKQQNNRQRIAVSLFGFKKSMGCRIAIFAVRNIINYFNERGSNVFMASLDTSKAFDRVNHFRLYTMLMNRHVPAAFLNN